MIAPWRQLDQAAKARTNLIVVFIIAALGLLLSGGVIAAIVYLFFSLTWLSSALPAPALSAPVTAGVRVEARIEQEGIDADSAAAASIARSACRNELPAIGVSD